MEGHLSIFIIYSVCSCKFFNLIDFYPSTYTIKLPSSFTAFLPNLLAFFCWVINGGNEIDFWIAFVMLCKFHLIIFPSLHTAYNNGIKFLEFYGLNFSFLVTNFKQVSLYLKIFTYLPSSRLIILIFPSSEDRQPNFLLKIERQVIGDMFSIFLIKFAFKWFQI